MEDLPAMVAAAQAGDLEAFGRVVTRFQDMACAAAAARVGDPDLAEDIAQDAFVEAFLSLPNLREPAAFPGWFRQILFRVCARRVRPAPVALLPLEAARDVPSEEPGPAQAAEADDLRERVRLALDGLPEHERLAAQLFYVSGCSYQEIASFLGVPLSTVKKRLHSARIRMKETVGALEPEAIQARRPPAVERFAREVRPAEPLRAFG